MSRVFRTPPNFAPYFFNEIARSAGALLLLLMPKCSLCLAAYLNIFTLMGISISRFASWIFPVLSLAIVSSLVIGFMKARKLNDYRAFAMSFSGMVLLIFDKIWFHQPALSWTGFVLIISAGLLQLIQSRRVCNQELI